ncbi:MAG: FkbM family methyltransferase, partial [Planctomycetaceae bacterium]
HEFPEATGVSTFDAELAEYSRKKLGVAYRPRPVRVETLESICERHAAQCIDFLSVDVEGHERQVLTGGDWKRFRPRVVVIEATRPHSTEPSHRDWEPLLLEADYLFAAFDGLNRYFVRVEDRALLPLLETPVNTFDDYLTATEHRALGEVRDLKIRLDTLEQMGDLTLAMSRRLNRFEGRFPAVSRAIHRMFRKSARGVADVESR